MQLSAKHPPKRTYLTLILLLPLSHSDVGADCSKLALAAGAHVSGYQQFGNKVEGKRLQSEKSAKLSLHL